MTRFLLPLILFSMLFLAMLSPRVAPGHVFVNGASGAVEVGGYAAEPAPADIRNMSNAATWSFPGAGNEGGVSANRNNPMWPTLASHTSSPGNAIPVSSILNSVGIDISPDRPATAYGNIAATINALTYLNIKLVRSGRPNPTNPAYAAIADAGIKFDFLLLGNGEVDVAGDVRACATFATNHPNSVYAIEGPNEIDMWSIRYRGITNTYQAGRAVQMSMWHAIKSYPQLANTQVWSLTLGVPRSFMLSQIGDLTPYLDRATIHLYDAHRANFWPNTAPAGLVLPHSMAPSKPIALSETGWRVDDSWVAPHSAAKYMLNEVFDNFTNGIATTMFFELADNINGSYGWYDATWKPRDTATAYHNLSTILAGAGLDAPVGSLNYTLSGLPGSGHSMVVGGQNKIQVVVWNDATIYDGRAETPPSPTSVTVTFEQTVSTVSVYDPMVGTAPLTIYNDVHSVTIALVDHPLILEVTPPAGTPAPRP